MAWCFVWGLAFAQPTGAKVIKGGQRDRKELDESGSPPTP